MQTLYISTTSPYTRILLMIAYLQKIDLQLKFVLPWENPSELTAVNSFSQVPALVWKTGEVITETPIIIQAIAPEVYSTNPIYNLPRIAKALGIIAQGVRAYSTERFGATGQAPHPFVSRSTNLLKQTLPNLPKLSADSNDWGDKILLCGLIWISIRLPEAYQTLSVENQQAVQAFENSELMQKLSTKSLERQPSSIQQL
ncbi:glutathione S-transferase N-terminal domain-containing protein [Faucicola boevrei]|uniref:glutathione S-transferase N-terminal domain-containing protein n=1 Tax=Faucicola boevrei TaxID=346665 RepID=UPI000375DC72|nr:glutathione S-transferase N-terminal domain-containing protein [Moraxella boevrei]